MKKFSEWLEHKLNAAERKDLPSKDFAEPGKEAYPIPDKNHGKFAIAMAAKNASPSEREKIDAKVHKKFPGIGKKDD